LDTRTGSETSKSIWEKFSPSPFQAVRNTQLVSPLLLSKARSEANWVALVVKINRLIKKTRAMESLMLEEVIVGMDFSALASIERDSTLGGLNARLKRRTIELRVGEVREKTNDRKNNHPRKKVTY